MSVYLISQFPIQASQATDDWPDPPFRQRPTDYPGRYHLSLKLKGGSIGGPARTPEELITRLERWINEASELGTPITGAHWCWSARAEVPSDMTYQPPQPQD